jgi:hypothetical protein
MRARTAPIRHRSTLATVVSIPLNSYLRFPFYLDDSTMTRQSGKVQIAGMIDPRGAG